MICVELGQNINGDVETAKAYIRVAEANGADAIKLQLYSAEKLYPKDSPYYKYGKMGELSYQSFKEIVKFASGAIEIFASVFDEKRVAWCESLKIPRYKIAARQWNNLELLEAVRKTGKPVIQSLDPYLITKTKRTQSLMSLPKKDIEVIMPGQYLYCCSKYPATMEDLHLNEVDFNEWDGLSDHTIGMVASLTALARGARIIEKHFTLDKFSKGFDHLWSMTPDELFKLASYQKVLKEVYGSSRDWIRSNGDEF